MDQITSQYFIINYSLFFLQQLNFIFDQTLSLIILDHIDQITL